nr:hypothetical protein [uncultured Sulfurimonas sp.]
MIIQTQYNYEKTWTTTNEADLIRIIKEEIGDVNPEGTLDYVKEAIKNGKTITVGTCKFKEQKSK